MDIFDLQDEALEKALSDFVKLEPGSIGALNQAKAIESLMKGISELDKAATANEERKQMFELETRKLEIEETKLDHDSNQRAMDRALESERIENEQRATLSQEQLAKIQLAFETGKLLFLIGFTAIQMVGIMKFEETGIIRSDAWKLLPGLSKTLKV